VLPTCPRRTRCGGRISSSPTNRRLRSIVSAHSDHPNPRSSAPCRRRASASRAAALSPPTTAPPCAAEQLPPDFLATFSLIFGLTGMLMRVPCPPGNPAAPGRSGGVVRDSRFRQGQLRVRAHRALIPRADQVGVLVLSVCVRRLLLHGQALRNRPQTGRTERHAVNTLPRPWRHVVQADAARLTTPPAPADAGEFLLRPDGACHCLRQK